MREGCVKVLSKRLQGAAEERGAGPEGSLSRNGIPESSLEEDPRCDPLHGTGCSSNSEDCLCSPKPFLRELSSVGSERLPYKQRVGGSTPSAPTR